MLGGEFVTSAWVKRQDDRNIVLSCYVDESAENLLQPLRVVGIIVAVYGGEDVSFGLQGEALHDVASLGCHLGEMYAIVVHHVTAVDYTPLQGRVLCEKAFLAQIVYGGLSRGEEDGGELVADDAVDLLWHHAVV